MLKLENIVKEYAVGDEVVRALKGVSIEFRDNEFVSILGPSGCGKTTLLNIIGGLDKYTSETILALNRLVQTKTIGLSIFQLSNTTYVSLEIIESEETSAYIGVDDRFIMDNHPIINFNPYLGIMSCKTNEILSPAACLGHELGHIFNAIESPKDFYMRRQTFCDDGWSQMEDFYTITNRN